MFDELRAMEKEMEALTQRMAELDPASHGVRGRSPTAITIWNTNSARAMDMRIEAQVGTVLTGLGFPQGRLGAADGGVFRRLADAHRAGQAAAAKAEPAAAGRADEPSGSRSAQLAGGVSERLSVCVRADLARPLFSRRDGRKDRRDLEQAVLLLHRQLRQVPGAEDSSGASNWRAAYRNQRERIEQLEAFINRFRYQATKAKQVQSRIKELEKIERIEIPAEEKTIHFTFPQPKPSGRIVAELQDVAKSYGRKAGVRRREFHHRARRPHRAGGRERRGQVDADQAAGRRRSRSTPANTSSGTTCEADYFAQDQYKELDPDARMLDDIGGLAPTVHADRVAQPAGMLPVFGR